MEYQSPLLNGNLLRQCVAAFFVCFALLFCGCGGGSSGNGGNGGSGGQNPGDFTIAASPNLVAVLAGGSVSTQLSVMPVSGFTGQVSVQVSGLPTGVTISPASIVLSPGTPAALTLSAAASVQATTATIQFTGVSSALQHSTSLSLTVDQAASGPFPTRTKYIRTDAVTEYYQWVNSHWLVYHAPTARFFVTDPFSNQVYVIDQATKSKVATIAVPGAYGIDATPDQSTLYVGTLIGDVYGIDPVGMKIKERYPIGYPAMIALVLSNGNLALLKVAEGIPSVDGSSSFAIWSPVNGAITIYGTDASPLCGSTLQQHIFSFVLTADRSAVITNGGSGGGTGLCVLNASTGQSVAANPSGNPSSVIVSPDGKYLALPTYPNAVELLDQKTLQSVTQISVVSDNLSAAAILFSPDSSTLYVSSSTVVNAYSVATQQLIGWIPNIVVEPSSGGGAVGPPVNPIYQAFDTSGLMVGPLEEGFGFLDTAHLQTGPPGQGLLNAYLSPATGPVSGGTPTEWSAPLPSEVFFGSNQAAFAKGTGDLITVTTPPGQPGPSDVYLFLSDGEMQLIPEGFSYGPTILEVAPNDATADGGGTGVIYGYGFGPANGTTTIPSGLSVSVDSRPATIAAFNPNAYGIFSPPFLLQSIHYTIPPGTAGSSVDVSVTSDSGTTTAKAALTYLPALKTYPLPGSSLVQGVYDPLRNVYYFTDTNEVQVFSLAQGTWLNPILIPAPQGTTQRLWGIALSPDASKLVIADSQAGVVYMLNPSNPASIQTFPIHPPIMVSGILTLPAGVAVTDAGVIWLTVDVQGGTGFHNFYKLDTITGTLTDLQIDGPGESAKDLYLRTVLSQDGARAYFNDEGYVFYYDTTTGGFFTANIDSGCCLGDYDLALAANESQSEASSYLYNFNLAALATFTLNDREIHDVAYVYGNKFSPDGTLLFQPATQGIDVYNGTLGTLRSRIALPVPVSTNYDALVSDGKDNILIVITGTDGNGIAVLDLTSLPQAAPLSLAVESLNVTDRENTRNSAKVTSETSTQATTERRQSWHSVPHLTNPRLPHR